MSKRNVECIEVGSPARHIPRSQAFSLVKNNEAEWADAEQKSIRKFTRKESIRGFSARYGDWLARYKHSDIGSVILAHTTLRPVEAP